ncbi:MAG: hypothetical protein JJU05_19285 [Verrucomicrobia bacterium]|nr:hypothetical protein [Verrucomicrobiota bacterium]
MTATQELKKQVENLTEPLAREVLDFLLQVANRHQKAAVLPGERSMRGRLAKWADVNKFEQEANAWEKVGLAKHASD